MGGGVDRGPSPVVGRSCAWTSSPQSTRLPIHRGRTRTPTPSPTGVRPERPLGRVTTTTLCPVCSPVSHRGGVRGVSVLAFRKKKHLSSPPVCPTHDCGRQPEWRRPGHHSRPRSLPLRGVRSSTPWLSGTPSDNRRPPTPWTPCVILGYRGVGKFVCPVVSPGGRVQDWWFGVWCVPVGVWVETGE